MKKILIRTLSKKHLENIKLALEIIALVVLIATLICYVRLVYLQREANRTSTQSLQTVQKALAQSQQANELTSKSIYLTQQSLHLNERAWISIEPKDVDLEEGKEYVVKLEIKNIGKTPAKKVESCTAGEFVQAVSGTEKVMIMPGTKIGDPSPDFTGEDTFLAQHQSPVFLVPQSPLSIEYHSGLVIMDKEMLERMKAGHAMIFVWGKVTYDDIFGISHWLSFCEIFDGHAWAMWSTHNDCDDNQ